MEKFEQLDQPQKRGQAAEAILKTEFQIRGIPTLVPEYDNQPYDFVIEVENELYKIQAKLLMRGKTTGPSVSRQGQLVSSRRGMNARDTNQK